MPPQQRHTKPKGQRRAPAALCGDVRVAAFWQELWQEHLARTPKSKAHSEPCSRGNSTRSQWASVNLQLFAVMCVWKNFGKNIWHDHESRAHSEPCSRNNSTRSQTKGQREPAAALCGNARVTAFLARTLATTFGKNTTSRAHTPQ